MWKISNMHIDTTYFKSKYRVYKTWCRHIFRLHRYLNVHQIQRKQSSIPGTSPIFDRKNGQHGSKLAQPQIVAGTFLTKIPRRDQLKEPTKHEHPMWECASTQNYLTNLERKNIEGSFYKQKCTWKSIKKNDKTWYQFLKDFDRFWLQNERMLAKKTN